MGASDVSINSFKHFFSGYSFKWHNTDLESTFCLSSKISNNKRKWEQWRLALPACHPLYPGISRNKPKLPLNLSHWEMWAYMLDHKGLPASAWCACSNLCSKFTKGSCGMACPIQPWVLLGCRVWSQGANQRVNLCQICGVCLFVSPSFT